MKNVAFLWWENEIEFSRDKPFDKEWKCKDYAEYTEMLRDREIKVVCGDYRWYEEGKMSRAFHWDGDAWKKVTNTDLDGVYDLFRHDEEKMEIKEKMKEDVGILNDPEVAQLCQDKLETYNSFQKHLPITQKASRSSVKEMLSRNSKVVLKPRFGSSGEGIRIIEEVPGSISDEMIVQEFMECDHLPEHDIKGPHDLRILVINGEPIGSYFRVPDEGLLSNVALGGKKKYVKLQNLPNSVFEIVDDVISELESYEPNIFTVDLMFSDGEPKIVELNSQPGIYYHGEGRKEKWEKPWMMKAVGAIESLVN